MLRFVSRCQWNWPGQEWLVQSYVLAQRHLAHGRHVAKFGSYPGVHVGILQYPWCVTETKKKTHPLACFATCLLEHVMTTRTSSSLHPVDLGTRGITLGQAQHRRVVEGTAGWSDRWRWGWMGNNVWMANSLFHLIFEPLIGSSFCTQTLFPCCFRPFPDWWKFELICSWDLCLLFRSRKCILFRGDSLTRMPVTTTTTCWALISEPAANMSRWSKRLRSWRFCYVVDKSWAEIRNADVFDFMSWSAWSLLFLVRFPWFFFSNFLQNPLTFSFHPCVLWGCQCSDLWHWSHWDRCCWMWRMTHEHLDHPCSCWIWIWRPRQ